jgi:DNA ligase-1
MQFVELVGASREIARIRSRTAKIERLAELFKRLATAEIEVAVGWLSGELRQGRVGLGGALLHRLVQAPAAVEPSVSVLDVDTAIGRFAAAQGRGSVAERERILGALFAALTLEEREFFVRACSGGLRQGALEGIALEALSRATALPASELRRALLFSGRLGEVATVALTEGREGLARFALALFRPLRPMLADTAGSIEEAVLGEHAVALEAKLDGARVQVHRSGSDVAVFSRQGQDVTASVPELVETVLALPARELVLDGEAIALRADGWPHPFQTTMQRFGRQKGVLALRETLPLSAFFFDCLTVDGALLIDRPNAERFAALSEHLPAELLIPREVTADSGRARAFVDRVLAKGHEGVMVKSLSAGYDAGRRGAGWLKVKPVNTLDLVILAAEWGNGRRTGLLSNVHLGARDPDSGSFVMLGKTFKGMTDEMLRWQTEEFQKRIVERDRYVVTLRPELVAEIAFDGVQQSTQYPGGLSLRFARVRRYRTDKRAEDANTIAEVRSIFERTRRNTEPETVSPEES